MEWLEMFTENMYSYISVRPVVQGLSSDHPGRGCGAGQSSLRFVRLQEQTGP
jgi:hypothetical protein